ncbi:MAG: tRNA dihydrouridine synthase DusB [Clostridia bacterium]
MKIGNVELKNNIFLAPMAGITDLPFRLICKENGAGLVYTEMVSAKALLYGDEKTKLLLKSCKDEKTLAVQIFGSDLEAIEYASKYVSEFADIVDINMGCPAPKVVKNGDGSKLLLDLNLVKQIVETAVKNSNVPVTVKMRIGWDVEHIVAVEAAKIIEKAGASAITVHGRTRSQYYSGEADWNIIKQVKESVKIPVIGNGDIRSKEDAKKAIESSKVDAIMIGRAAVGNPWIFRECVEYLEKGICVPKASKEERLNTMLKHIDLEIAEKGENIAIKEMRKHLSAYTKNLPGSSQFRSMVNTLNTKKEVEKCIKQYFKNIE